MTDRAFDSIGRRLVSGSVLRVANLIVAALASMFLMPFIVHHIGDRAYGFWSLATGFIGYYGLLDFGLTSAVSQHMSVAMGRKEPEECRAVFNTALRIQSLIGVVVLLLAIATAAIAPLFCQDPQEGILFRKVIILLGLSAALAFPVRTYGGVLDATFRFDIWGSLGILGVVLRTGLLVAAIMHGGGLLALAWMTFFASLPVMVLQVWFARREALWARLDNLPLQKARTRSLFSYSIHVFLTSIGDTLRFQIDPLVISGLVSLAAVTHYRTAGVFAQYYMQLLILSVGILQPVFSRLHGAGDKADLEKLFFFGTKVSLCISAFVCIALACWGKVFIARWMGPAYEDGYWPLVALSFAVFLDVGQKPSIDMLFATFTHQRYAYLNFAEGAINLIVSVILARPLGILGVALGTLVAAFLVRVLVQPRWVCKATGFNYRRYLLFVADSLARCCILAGAAVIVAAWGMRPSYSYMVGSVLCAIAVYAAGSWLVLFNSRERKLLFVAVAHPNHDNVKAHASTIPAS